MGGWSSEREVSLTSGRGVAEGAADTWGWSNVTEVDMDRNVAQVLTGLRPDVVFTRSTVRRVTGRSRAC